MYYAKVVCTQLPSWNDLPASGRAALHMGRTAMRNHGCASLPWPLPNVTSIICVIGAVGRGCINGIPDLMLRARALAQLVARLRCYIFTQVKPGCCIQLESTSRSWGTVSSTATVLHSTPRFESLESFACMAAASSARMIIALQALCMRTDGTTTELS